MTHISLLKPEVSSIITNSHRFRVKICSYICLLVLKTVTTTLFSQVVIKFLCKTIISSVKIVQKRFPRIFHVAGELLQDSACCKNLLSQASMQDSHIFSCFSKSLPACVEATCKFSLQRRLPKTNKCASLGYQSLIEKP